MEFVLRCVIYSLLLILSGFMFGTVFRSRYERKFREKSDATRGELTKPESYIWVDKNEHLPEHDGEYIVEYRFGENGSMIFHRIDEFSTSRNRFHDEGWYDMIILRWAELPK